MYEHNSQNALYRSPFGAVESGTEVKLRFFAEKDTKAVYVCTEKERYTMELESEICGGRMFSLSFIPAETCFYRFEILSGSGTVVYGCRPGETGGIGETGSQSPFQITVYSPFALPQWFLEGIGYQIFPDRFCPGGPRADCGISRTWGETPFYRAEQFGGEYRANDFFGGTLWGVAEKLPYLKELGVTWIYLNPIFDTSSNHGYNTRNYMHVADHLGGDAAFAHLAEEAGKVGIHLILDGVFSHTGDDSIYFQSALQNPDSPYREWYTFTDAPPGYEAWWGIPSLPNVREETPSYMEFMLGEHGVIRHWLRLGADGWRLDVADELPDGFLDGLRRAVKTEKPDSVIIGEVWEDASNKISYGQRRRYLTGKQLDCAMQYPLRQAIIDFTCERTDAVRLWRQVLALAENYPPAALYGGFSFLSGHDVPRILTILGEAPTGMDRAAEAAFRLSPEMWKKAVRRLRVALALLVTMPGVPCVFYGDEAGMEGYGDPFCRGTYPWGEESETVRALYKELLALRKSRPELSGGHISGLYAENRVIGFWRGQTAVYINGGWDAVQLQHKNTEITVLPMDYRLIYE